MARSEYLFTSESVSEGHPDKVCDRISDSIVDLFLGAEAEARVAVETLVTTNRIVLAGEVRGPDSITADKMEAAARNAVVTLSAFDTSGVRLAEVHTVLQADSVITGTVSEDTFLGVHAPEGIAEVRLSNRLFNFEIDHLQFGRDCGGQPCEACE